jgi:hypothetical protein
MRCRDVTEHYTEYQEGGLSWWKRWLIKMHLEYCPGCGGYHAQMSELKGALKRLGDEKASGSIESKAADAFEKWRTSKK